MTCRGVRRIFLNTGLFLLSDVEYSCLPDSLNDLVRIKRKSRSVQICFIELLTLLQLLEWEGFCSKWGQDLRLDREVPSPQWSLNPRHLQKCPVLLKRYKTIPEYLIKFTYVQKEV